jgi:hypothetical protein
MICKTIIAAGILLDLRSLLSHIIFIVGNLRCHVLVKLNPNNGGECQIF